MTSTSTEPVSNLTVPPPDDDKAVINTIKEEESASGGPKPPRRRNKFIKPNLNRIRILPPAPQTSENAAEPPLLSPPPEPPAKTEFFSVPSPAPSQGSEPEYPPPPPSPSKISRSRIKAVPRLGQRHASFSASESEDESRRNYQRIRNDSVSSAGVVEPAPECPPKQKEFNILIQRKCRRTEQSRKLAEARREFYHKFGNNTPDRHKLTMIDLIFYNPTTNPMKNEPKTAKEPTEPAAIVETPEEEKSDEENEIPAPQIKIGPAGELVVDEQSLVIESNSVKRSREEMAKRTVIDGNFETGYGLYKRAKRSKDWSKNETIKFYKALNTIGTDFTLMCELFPRRTRRELKMKFKKEERVNRALVDKAIMQPCGFDFNEFKAEIDLEEEEMAEVERQKEREVQLRKEVKVVKRRRVEAPRPKLVKCPPVKPRAKKRALDILSVLGDDTSDADDEFDEASNGFEGEEEDDDDERRILENMRRPTRSGRIPKVVHQAKEEERGSLKVSTGIGANGQPVYNVYMVVGDREEHIGSDFQSLEKAMECKENCEFGAIKSLFKISATPISEEGEVIIGANE